MKQFKMLSVAMLGILLLTAFNASAMMRRASRFVPLTQGRSMFTFQGKIYALASERAQNATEIQAALTSGNKVMLVQDGLDKYFFDQETTRIFAPVVEMSIPEGSDKIVYQKQAPVAINSFNKTESATLSQSPKEKEEPQSTSITKDVKGWFGRRASVEKSPVLINAKPKHGGWNIEYLTRTNDLPAMSKLSAVDVAPDTVASPELIKGLKTFGQYRQELDDELKRIEALKIKVAAELDVDPFK